MGSVFTVIGGVGSLMSGIGACWVAETAVTVVGNALKPGKFISACVGVTSVTAGGYAFELGAKGFLKEWKEIGETIDSLKAAKEQVKAEAAEQEKKYA